MAGRVRLDFAADFLAARPDDLLGLGEVRLLEEAGDLEAHQFGDRRINPQCEEEIF
jgi:hypothetical protein